MTVSLPLLAAAPARPSESGEQAPAGIVAESADASGEGSRPRVRDRRRDQAQRVFTRDGYWLRLAPLGVAASPHCCFGNVRYAWSLGFGYRWHLRKRLGVSLGANFLHSSVVFDRINEFRAGSRVRIGGTGRHVFGYGLAGVDFGTTRNFTFEEVDGGGFVFYYALLSVGGGVMGAVAEHVSLGVEVDAGFPLPPKQALISFDLLFTLGFHWGNPA